MDKVQNYQKKVKDNKINTNVFSSLSREKLQVSIKICINITETGWAEKSCTNKWIWINAYIVTPILKFIIPIAGLRKTASSIWVLWNEGHGKKRGDWETCNIKFIK
jgi:hypothetical protein